MTAGIVSARGRDIGAGSLRRFPADDAPVNKGNSGGPTFNTEGSVIGVNTAIFSPSGGSVGIAFAIPSETVRKWSPSSKTRARSRAGGLACRSSGDAGDCRQPRHEEGWRRARRRAAEGCPAAKAGIQAGDVIASVNDKPVTDARDLARKIGGLPPGTTVKLGILRGRLGQDSEPDARRVAECP